MAGWLFYLVSRTFLPALYFERLELLVYQVEQRRIPVSYTHLNSLHFKSSTNCKTNQFPIPFVFRTCFHTSSFLLDAIGSAEGVLRICKICDVPAVIAVRRDATLAGSLINALIAAGQYNNTKNRFVNYLLNIFKLFYICIMPKPMRLWLVI